MSVIVTTYNREDALASVLRGLAHQTDGNFEVVIADDGSGSGTRAVIDAMAGQLSHPIKHAWQEHRGFRAGEARNRAILMSAGAYCVFLDGDCIPRRSFIVAHRRLAEAGWFVTGNRVLLSSDITDRCLNEGSMPERWPLRVWARLRRNGGVNRVAPLLSLPLGPLRKLRQRAWRGARSCNLAVWRRDLDRVDGFDGAYSGWGLEDSDLLIRLLRAGLRRKDGNYATAVVHLWHADSDRSILPDNARRLDEVTESQRVRANLGLSAVTALP